jgi:hypothetical protein
MDKTFKGKAIYNPGGKAARRLASNGYYAVYMPNHPNAFGIGYVYEHRLIIENEIGRLLKSTEIVHHKDGNKLNNNIANLELCHSIAEHKVKHRKSNSKIRRNPDETNVIVKCACGCGMEFLKYDAHGRERKYANSGCGKRHTRILRQEEQGKEIVFCACGCGSCIMKYDKYGRIRKYISGHNRYEIPNRTYMAKDTGLSFATIINYFKGNQLKVKTINLIEISIIKNYGKEYIRK